MTPPHIPPLPSPPYTLRPTFTRALSLLNPLDYLRLLYWVFFHPQWLRDYVKWCEPKEFEATGLKIFRIVSQNNRLRALLAQTIILTIATPFALSYALQLLGLPVNYANVAGGVASGVLFGVAFSVLFGVAVGVAGGVLFGVAFGVVFGVAAGGGVGVAIGVLGGLFGVAV